jgi:hypothetical protein
MPIHHMEGQLRDMLARLRAAGRYSSLVGRLEATEWPPRSLIFEAIFADTFETAGCPLRYEAPTNSGSAESMDFVYPANSTA